MEGNADYEKLRLENQLCFPLYACAKEVVRRYKPWLDELDLTYTQYIVMMVLWEQRQLTVKELGETLYLDSGTLTPVLKKLEAKGLVTRHRCAADERILLVGVTEEGEALRALAARVPEKMGKCICLEAGEAKQLYLLLYKVLGGIWKEEEKDV